MNDAATRFKKALDAFTADYEETTRLLNYGSEILERALSGRDGHSNGNGHRPEAQMDEIVRSLPGREVTGKAVPRRRGPKPGTPGRPRTGLRDAIRSVLSDGQPRTVAEILHAVQARGLKSDRANVGINLRRMADVGRASGSWEVQHWMIQTPATV